MRLQTYIATLMLAGAAAVSAQVAPLASSHPPVVNKAANAAPVAAPSAKPAVRVNGVVLTEIDVRREMHAMFPYADQHNGFPKAMEAEIRKGAVEMVIFEELLYQEATRRNLAIAPERVARAEAAFRKQFPEKATYDQYLRAECKGSPQVLKEKIRRSLLIEKMLKSEVEEKSVITLAAARTYYDKNPKQFERAETVAIQTISIIPPENASPAVKAEAKAKIKDIARLGREAKTARDFGLIAEQLSEDDWRTKLGDRGAMDVRNLPPDVVKAARALKPGNVSDPIQLGNAWVVIRLNAHTPAGKVQFAEIKSKLQSDLHKQKREQVRAALNQKLRKDAKIELL
jgi:peptidyl-prolyl cis-trans isomerase SurA